VVPITTADFPTPAQRPASSVLDSTTFQQQFGFVPPDWHDGLHGVIDQLAGDRPI
jgi:dTDP-4-dehydrorhamnose reductase